MSEKNEKTVAEVQRELNMARTGKTIVECTVRAAIPGTEEHPEYLLADYNGFSIVVPKSELDDTHEFKSLLPFVGRKLRVIIRTVDKATKSAVGSVADAQRITKETLLPRLEAGEEFEATVVNAMKHGVYVDVDGITGLLTNADFAYDTTRAYEILHVGETVKVKLRHINKAGTFHFKAVEKYCAPNALREDQVQVGMNALGIVRKVRQYGSSYLYVVNVTKGVDVLCFSEIESAVQADDKVTLKITKMGEKDGKRVIRGVIKSIIYN